MADISITAASVIQGANAVVDKGRLAGAAITAGQQLYLDTTNTWKLADADGATALIRTATGTALHAASTGQPLAVQTRGLITIGGTLTAGVAYYLSGTPGGLCPVADVGTGEYVDLIGLATSASVLDLLYVYTGVAN